MRFDPAALIKGVDQKGVVSKDVDTDRPQAVLERLADILLQGTMSAATRRTLLAKGLPKEGGTVDVAKVTSLILGSPEFQRR